MAPDSAALLDSLRSAVGPDHVLTDADLRASYETDWSRRWHGDALAVVRPASADEMVAVVRACTAAGVAIIPQGGNTGLVGGSVPREWHHGSNWWSRRSASATSCRSMRSPAR